MAKKKQKYDTKPTVKEKPFNEWLDTTVIQEIIEDSLRDFEIPPTDNNCKKTWLKALEYLNEIIDRAIEEIEEDEDYETHGFCEACGNKLREMTPEDADDDRIIAGYLICDKCGGEYAE